MSLTPTPQQMDDAAFLLDNRRACLFSEPGTGKTLTAITGLTALNDPRLRVLVICPRIAVGQWVREMRAQGLKAEAFRTGADFRNLPAPGAGVAVVTTWTLMASQKAKLAEWSPAVIVADESHAAMDIKAARTRALYGDPAKRTEGLVSGVPMVWLLTGTPIVRFADDLWPALNALFPKKLVSLVGTRRRAAFFGRYVGTRLQRISGGRMVPTPAFGKNEEEIEAALYHDLPIAVRRRLVDVDAALPARRERDIEVELDDMPAEIIAALKGLSDDDLARDTDAVKSIRRAFGRAKIKSSVDYVSTVSEPALILAWHGDVIEALAAATPGAMVIDGSTSEADRAKALAHAAGGGTIIGQISAVGTALDGLQHGMRRVIFAERIGSPALMEQAIRRVWRRGQTGRVQIDFLRAEHRLERVTDAALAAKAETQARAIG